MSEVIKKGLLWFKVFTGFSSCLVSSVFLSAVRWNIMTRTYGEAKLLTSSAREQKAKMKRPVC